jgi:uncharacterized Fe-S cluster protein YjdI
MAKRLQAYDADGALVTFDPNVCIHSGVCLRTLPRVFDVSEKRWIRPERASVDEIVAAVGKCPSGALQVIRAGSAPLRQATIAPVVEVTVRPNGPLIVRGPVHVIKENGEAVDKETCAFCRCGGTANAPFCDGTHNRNGFRSPS